MQTSEEPVPRLDLVQRTLAVDISYRISRMKVLQRLPGNPIGIDYRWIDETAVALMSRLSSFSRVVGLRLGHEGHVEPLMSWYREHGIKPTFEMIPGHYGPSLGREMARLDLFQSGFHVSLIGDPARVIGVTFDDRMAIDRVTTAETMEDYLDAYVAGWGIPEKDEGQFKINVRPWLERPPRVWTLDNVFAAPEMAAGIVPRRPRRLLVLLRSAYGGGLARSGVTRDGSRRAPRGAISFLGRVPTAQRSQSSWD
jgi:hypothetical protein